MYDSIIIGSGVSGSFIAERLVNQGKSVLMIEAGRFFDKSNYPENELDANSKLFWSGGIELNNDVDLAFLRPKCVGGGSIVNQALLDRFDDTAFSEWRKVSGIDFLNESDLDSYYSHAEGSLIRNEVPEEYWNENVRIFQKGFEANGYKWGRLKRGQSDCKNRNGNDCIECLGGCPLDSKQSMPVTVLKKALSEGLELKTETTVDRIVHEPNSALVHAKDRSGRIQKYQGKTVVLAAGAIGNSIIAIKSGFHLQNPNVGKYFWSHPQEMSLGIYDQKIEAFKGGFQALKSDEPMFREQGFKLENVFGPPGSLAMLFKATGAAHQDIMKQIAHMACVEVAVRDTNPGTIRLSKKGKLQIDKKMNLEDLQRKAKGLDAIDKIFKATGAKKVIRGDISIGLHLMGGMVIGSDPSRSVTGPDFNLHYYDNIFAADSSIFPTAPGFNPSLTIMALSTKASEVIASYV